MVFDAVIKTRYGFSLIVLSPVLKLPVQSIKESFSFRVYCGLTEKKKLRQIHTAVISGFQSPVLLRGQTLRTMTSFEKEQPGF